jgi:hypothetical protein
MANGHLTITADADNKALAERIRQRFGDPAAHGGRYDVSITSSVPRQPVRHVVITGPLDESVDSWDADLPPQTVAGALWLAPSKAPEDTAAGWLALRLSMPAGPLSDLTDDNDRALRWSVAEATTVTLPHAPAAEADEDEVRRRLDEQPEVKALGEAVERLGGETAESVLKSAERFRAALDALDGLAPLPPAPALPGFDTALSGLVVQVSRRGISRWRSGRARLRSRDGLVAAAKDAAGGRLRSVIDALTQEAGTQRAVQAEEQRRADSAEALSDAVRRLELPAEVDIGRSPRPWSIDAPPARRYVLVNEQDLEMAQSVEAATVRDHEWVPPGTALCLVLQSGFSLPALRA